MMDWMELLGGPASTGAAVVAGLAGYEQLKNRLLLRNGSGITAFTAEDRRTLQRTNQVITEQTGALDRIATVIDRLDRTIVRMDERDKITRDS